MLSTLLKGHNPCWHDVALLAYHLADVAQDPDALGNPLIKMVWTSPLNSTSPAEEGSGLVGIVPSSTSTLILFCGASSSPGTTLGCAASIGDGNKIKQTRNMFRKKFGTHIPKLTPSPQSWYARMHVINSECFYSVLCEFLVYRRPHHHRHRRHHHHHHGVCACWY